VHRETQPRVKLIRYAAGALVALTAAWLVVLWPDILKWWQS
jgi:hypothetical protein